jgi:hypothetical protein
MNFCPSCGASLNNNSKFCASCGKSLDGNTNNVTNNYAVKEVEELLPPLPPKKRVPVWVWILGAIGIIVVIGMIYGAVTYPKNEAQVENLLCNKYWKEDDIAVEEIYFDGKMVSKGSSFRSKLSNATSGIDGDAEYKKVEAGLKAMFSYDNYIYFKKMSGGNYWKFDQSIDSKNLRDFIFSLDNFDINKKSGHFVLNRSNKTTSSYYVETGELYDSYAVDEERSEILSLDDKKLTIRNTLVMGSVKLVISVTYKSSPESSHDTRQLKSYLTIFELGNGFTAPANEGSQPVDSGYRSATETPMEEEETEVAVDTAAAY